MSIGLLIAVAVGAGVGSVARYALSLRAHRDHFPWPTIVANTVGTALLGVALAVVAQERLGYPAFAILGMGVAGGLTTFSTLALDAVRLARTRHLKAASWYLGATLGLGLVASYAGWVITMAVLD